MNVCRNAYPIEEGAWVRRSGNRFAATSLNGKPARVMPFEFEQSSPYIMEFTDNGLRLFAVATQTQGLSGTLPNDFRLVTTNDNQGVTSISTADPAVVQTLAAHGWANGDQIEFLFAQSVNAGFVPLLRNRQFVVKVVDTTHFSITDPITGNTIDGNTLGWSAPAASTVVVARIFKSGPPYVNGDWAQLRNVQAETETILLHNKYQPVQLNVVTLPTATSFATFSQQFVTFNDGPYMDPPTNGGTLTPSGTTGAITLLLSFLGSVNNGLGFIATDIGRSIRILSEPAAWAVGTAYIVGNSVKFNGTYFTCIQNNTGQTPDIAIAYWSINTAAAVWSWGTITGIVSNVLCDFIIDGVDLLYTAAVATWRMGLYSNTTGWPSCGLYYEGRLWLAGSVPNRFDASVVNGITAASVDMTPTAADGTVADNNAISYTFNADDVNPIYWMFGTDAGIIAGTQSGEWLIKASQLSDPLTPTSIQAHRATTYGSEPIEPAASQLTFVFVQRFGRAVLECFPDVFSGKYNAPNLSTRAKHLLISTVDEIRYQQELVPLIWCRCGDGSLVGATYERNTLYSSQGPEFIGWHRHDLGSGRLVESITVGPSVDGNIDTLVMVTNDPATGIRHIELMESLFDVGADIKSGWFLDDSVVPSGGVITQSGSTVTLTFYGLWHLNGKTVTVWCGGIDCGDFTVANGAVALPIDYDIAALFTSDYLASISSTTAYGAMSVSIDRTGTRYTVPAVVGFTYTSQGQLLRPDTIDEVRSPTGPGLAKPRRNHQFGALLSGTQGISFGTDFSKLRAAQLKSPGGTVALTALQLYSGVYWDTLADDYSLDGMLCWQVSRPYPAAVVSMTGFMNTQDR